MVWHPSGLCIQTHLSSCFTFFKTLVCRIFLEILFFSRQILIKGLFIVTIVSAHFLTEQISFQSFVILKAISNRLSVLECKYIRGIETRIIFNTENMQTSLKTLKSRPRDCFLKHLSHYKYI